MRARAEKTGWIGDTRESPVGEIWVAVSSQGVVALDFPASRETISDRLRRFGFTEVLYDPEKVEPVLAQIKEYLHGERHNFDLQIDWSVMTPFQSQALKATKAIPYGETVSYNEIARRIGRPRAARAVGRAQATNPLPLIIPCHRVLGSDGGLHGYGAGDGLSTKAWLLQMESSNSG
jgi:methylated-DNA-[protein]-cysteine S-methyltransferase